MMTDLNINFDSVRAKMPNYERDMAKQAQDAGNIFKQNIAKSAFPITRMIDDQGNVDYDAIKNRKPPQSKWDMWAQLQEDLAGTGRNVDPMIVSQQHDQATQMFNENIFDEINIMRQNGMSDKEIRKAFSGNKDLLDYIYRNQEIGLQPGAKPTDWGKVGGTALVGLGSIGGAIGAERAAANLMNRTFAVGADSELSKSLREKGFQRKGKFGIKRLSDRQIERDLGIKRDTDLRPKKKDGTPNKRFKKRVGVSPEDRKKILDYKKDVDKRVKNSRQLRKALDGNKGAGGRVLRNVPKYVTKEPGLALRASKWARKIPRYGGLISAGILGSAAAGGALSKLFEED